MEGMVVPAVLYDSETKVTELYEKRKVEVFDMKYLKLDSIKNRDTRKM